MVINPKYRLDLAVSKDEVHPAENHIFINNGTAVACDNHILAIVPVQMEEGDSEGMIPVDALKAARRSLAGLQSMPTFWLALPQPLDLLLWF